jgi:hypothetical protein
MKTERYNITLKQGLLTENPEEELSLLKSTILDFLSLNRTDAEKQFGLKPHTESWHSHEFYYGEWYSKLTENEISLKRISDESVEMRIRIVDNHISTPTSLCYALGIMLRKMTDCSVNIEYIRPEMELLLLGPVKQPEYCHGYDWNEDEEENERVQWYHTGYAPDGHSNHQIEQTVYYDSYRVEVYGIHLFYDENEMWDYLEEEYPDIKEI